MTGVDVRRFEMLARVREFGATHSEIFAPDTYFAELLATISAVIDEISTHYTAQQSGASLAQAGGVNRTTARERVLSSLDAIRRSAREIAAQIPGADRQFQMPRSTGDQAVLGAARTFVTHAGPLKPLFARQRLDAEFFARLDADITAFEQALSAQRRGRETRVEATAAITKATVRGVRAARSLNTLMLNSFGKDSTVFASWKSVSRVHAPNGHGVSAAEPATPPTAG